MKNPELWTKSDLHKHLQQAIDLEFWTIPLYLTALYSIKGLKGLEKKECPDAAKLIESVVIQEMLHLEIVCNLCNALGYAPKFNPPKYEGKQSIPFIHPDPKNLPKALQDFTVKLGPLDTKSLKLFCVIELPEAKGEISWEAEKAYNSIGEFYTALELGIKHMWADHYAGDANNNKQKETFKEYHNQNGRHHGFSQIVKTEETAMRAIKAIIEQGEGADAVRVHRDYQPPSLKEGDAFDPGWFRGDLSHYHKFRILLHHHHKLPTVYQEFQNTDSQTAQVKLDDCYRAFLLDLEKSFNLQGPEMSKTFWKTMFGLQNAMIEVWESGSCPQFKNVL